MKIIYRKNLDDGRRVIVYDEGNNMVVILIDSNGKLTPKSVSLWNWEEKLVKLLGIKKEDLGL